MASQTTLMIFIKTTTKWKRERLFFDDPMLKNLTVTESIVSCFVESKNKFSTSPLCFMEFDDLVKTLSEKTQAMFQEHEVDGESLKHLSTSDLLLGHRP
jgi:hypothetical protein